MKKQILNLGKALNKAEQKSINGGAGGCPTDYGLCMSMCNGQCINFGGYNPRTGTIDFCYVCITEEQ